MLKNVKLTKCDKYDPIIRIQREDFLDDYFISYGDYNPQRCNILRVSKNNTVIFNGKKWAFAFASGLTDELYEYVKSQDYIENINDVLTPEISNEILNFEPYSQFE